jgi:CheY-like chemotaxis protein
MNAIIGMTRLALDNQSDPHQQKLLQTVKNAADNLLGILNDILDFSKIEAGQLLLSKKSFVLRQLMETVLSTLNVPATEKGLRLEYIKNEDLPPVLVGDDMRLRQIFFNLVGNAIKFTDTGGVTIRIERVSASTSLDGCILHCSVTDTGIGIESDKQERIFNTFEQADGTYARNYGGAGLGLAISRQLTEMMNGRMWVESTPGVGSTFHFTVGLEPGEEAPGISAPAIGRVEPLKITGLRILVVDDNEVNRDLTRMVLEHDHQVSTAVHGLAALQVLAEKEGFDVVLMDVQMPVMDGLTATRIIRAIEQQQPPPGALERALLDRLSANLTGKHVPIIAMTAHAMGGDQEMCRVAGMDEYITKPFQPEQLIGALVSIKGLETEDYYPIADIRSSIGGKHSDAAPLIPATIEQVWTFFQTSAGFTPEQVEQLLATSRKSITGLLAHCDRSLQQGDFQELGLAAHTLKGTLLQCGLAGWAERAQSLFGHAGSENGMAAGKDLSALRGALVSLLLTEPAASEEVLHPAMEDDGAAERKPARGRILVMDDEEVIRDVVSGMLDYLGCACGLAATGEEALALYARALAEGKPYDLVMTDLQVAGGMGGEALVKEIHALDPAACVLVSSGDSQDPVMQRYREHGFQGMLKKPYSIRNLSAMLDEMLGPS